MTISDLILKHKVKGIIIGLLLQNGVPFSNHCKYIEGLVKHMYREEVISVPTTFIDEKLSTLQAGRLIKAMQVDKGFYDRNLTHNKNV